MMKNVRKLKPLVMLPLCALFFFIGAVTVQAATYYVATTGNDAQTCAAAQTITTPKRTIASGISCLSAGSTLYIRGGTYPERISSNAQTIPTGTSWSAPVTIAGYPGETVILNPAACEVLGLPASYLQYIIFKDMILDGTNLTKSTSACVGISTQPGTHHLRFQNLEVKNSPWHGILGGGNFHEFINLKVHDSGRWSWESGYGPGSNGAYLTTDNSIVDGGEYYNNLCYGVRFFNSAPPSGDNNVVKNARIHTNGRNVAFGGTAVCNSMGGGIVLGDANNAAYNNLIYGNYLSVQIYSSASSTKIYNNTLYNNQFGINLDAGSVNTQVRNNILFQNGSGISNLGSGSVFSTNLCSASGPGCSLIGNPLFVTLSGYDLRIQAGSPAIDAGTQLSEVVNDFALVPRPQGTQYDIGAYEATGAINPPPARPANLQVF